MTPSTTSPTASTAHRIDIATFVIGGLLTLSLLGVVARVAQLQFAPGERLAGFIDERTSVTPHRAPRGDIVDRRGRVLAASRFGWRVIIDPTELEEPLGPKVVEVARAVGLDPDTMGGRIFDAIRVNKQRSAEGDKPSRYVAVTDLIDDASAQMVRNLGYAGVHLEVRPVRELVGGSITAPLVGKVGFEGDGLVGAELLFDGRLKPTTGSIRYVRDHMARPMWVDEAGLTPPKRGENIRLGLDLTIQQIALEELKRGVEHADAQGGRCVVVDPATGEILAMVQHRRKVEGLVEWDPALARERGPVRYRVTPIDPNERTEPALVRNRCVEDVFEPGSAFKPFVWASITQRGKARPDETFKTHWGEWKVPGIKRTLHDVTEAKTMTWREVLLYSSNIGMAQGAMRLSKEQLRGDVLRFGFGTPTRIGLAGEASGLVTSPRDWGDYTQTSVCMGQEVAVSPLQLVRAFCVFARNGELAGTLPSLRLEATTPGDAASQLRNIVLTRDISYMTREILAGVAERMRTRFAQLFPDEPDGRYTLFGKSGTAQVAKPTGGGYLENQYISSFVGGAPLGEPRLVVLVSIEDPGPSRRAILAHYGSPAAGPVVLRIMDRALEYLGVPADRVDGQDPARLAAGE